MQGGVAALLISDRQTRAVLLAELEERGLEVRAWPSAEAGFRALLTRPLSPSVIVVGADTDSAVTPEWLMTLAETYPEARLVVLLSAYGGEPLRAALREQDVVLTRPYRIGDVVEAVMGQDQGEVSGS